MTESQTRATPLTLLTLPTEIRSNIWKILLSRQGIHLTPGKRKLCEHKHCSATACPSSFRWICYVCTNTGTRTQLHHWFRSANHFGRAHEHRKWEKTSMLDWHGVWRCDVHLSHKFCGWESDSKAGEDALSTELRHNIRSLLHVCRSVSKEAAHVLYNTNTFTFLSNDDNHNKDDVANSFAKWIGKRTARQRQSLGGLELSVGYMALNPTHIYGNSMWEQVLLLDMIRELTQLTRLHICLTDDYTFMERGKKKGEILDFGKFMDGDPAVMHKVLDINDLLACFGRLKACPLKEVTSVVTCCRFQLKFPRILPTQSQRKTLANHFVSAVRGHEVQVISSAFAAQIDQEEEDLEVPWWHTMMRENEELDEDMNEQIVSDALASSIAHEEEDDFGMPLWRPPMCEGDWRGEVIAESRTHHILGRLMEAKRR